jgi:hypothetical protein
MKKWGNMEKKIKKNIVKYEFQNENNTIVLAL